MSQVHLTVKIDKATLDSFKELVDTEERTVSQDVRLYIQKRLEREKAKRDRAQGQAAAA